MTGTDGRLARGERTRTAVLDAAVALASEAGLDGLSLGQLAERLHVSKSGLFAHWSSKEELQLAAIEHARDQWARRVVGPALDRPRGVRRLFALHESRLAFYSERVLPGGCFFAIAEFESTGRTGTVPDRLAVVLAEWITLLERLVTEAVELGELPFDTVPRRLAFEVDAAGVAALLHSRLLARSLDDARQAVLARLRGLATDPDLLPHH
ncbi:TetR/AcrR family transcriptional regulator [Catellatospora citrea]|uniref:TetR family transcriptional regulator n=1 Tax=Catellatospora citrea TaxID=53366 RepID=A0A8J3P3E9_9ACTN|nr:TetR/AcrR family transcriptional regulator [Catellatospora citrea]RKE08772.1 TetR family transcriptional regulator [Catellatospora citrea]GIG02269.1 TetR family transcriptional regulator [Catellatospora citrea]